MKMPLIKKIIGKDKDLLVTEIGYSAPVGGLTVGPRSREIYLLHVVTKGYCDFSGFRVQAGQAFFISKGRLHSFTVSDGYEHYWIGFTGSAAEGLLAQFSLSADLHRLFYVEDPAFAQSLFALTLSALEDAENERAAPIALSLLTALLPLLKKEKHSHTPLKANYAEQARMYIHANYGEPIKMNEIARHIHLSEKYMYRLFTKEFGIPPQKYLLKTRMEAAKAMLAQGEYLIKEVSLSVGYASLASFTKAFTAYFGISPRRFRNS